MASFVVVKVTDGATMNALLDHLEILQLPYNVCSEDNLQVPDDEASTSAIEVTVQSEASTRRVAQATVTAEVIPSGKEIDISTLLCHGDDSSGEVTIPKEHRTLRTLFESLEGRMKPDISIASLTLPPPRRRAANNIKRYRRQICKLCGSSSLVPFLRTKMVHAATHSDFKRYKCPHCDKRGVSVATITLHIKSRHPGKPHNEYFDEMNEEEYVKLLLLTEKCFDDPYM